MGPGPSYNGLRITVVRDEVSFIILHTPIHIPLFTGIHRDRIRQIPNTWADYVEPLPSGITLSLIDNARANYTEVRGNAIPSVEESTLVIITIYKLNNEQVGIPYSSGEYGLRKIHAGQVISTQRNAKGLFNKVVVFSQPASTPIPSGGAYTFAVPGIDIAVNLLTLPRNRASELLSKANQATALMYGEGDNNGLSFI